MGGLSKEEPELPVAGKAHSAGSRGDHDGSTAAMASLSVVPPVLLMHGTADPWVEFKCSEDAERRLRLAGVDVSFERYRGLDHGHTWPGHVYRAALDRFLTEVLTQTGEHFQVV